MYHVIPIVTRKMAIKFMPFAVYWDLLDLLLLTVDFFLTSFNKVKKVSMRLLRMFIRMKHLKSTSFSLEL